MIDIRIILADDDPRVEHVLNALSPGMQYHITKVQQHQPEERKPEPPAKPEPELFIPPPESAPTVLDQLTEPDPPKKRGRGRPRKIVEEAEDIAEPRKVKRVDSPDDIEAKMTPPDAKPATLTIDDLRVAIKQMLQTVGSQPIQELFRRYKINLLPDLAVDEYPTFLRELRGLEKG